MVACPCLRCPNPARHAARTTAGCTAGWGRNQISPRGPGDPLSLLLGRVEVDFGLTLSVPLLEPLNTFLDRFLGLVAPAIQGR